MPARLSDLVSSFRTPLEELLELCETNETPMRPFYTVRHPGEQAKLWRQSRSSEEVSTGIEWLRQAGAPWLASIVAGVGPTFGRWATNAAPGNSWHQWGEAADCYALVHGRISWDTRPGQVGGPGDAFYRFYSETAAELGLRSLGTMGDWVHVQGPQESAPDRRYKWPEIDATMRRRFAA